jgi:cation-transporting P-type ATPase 13A2
MACLIILSGINTGILLKPTHAVSNLLDLMILPFDGRLTLLWIVLGNVAASFAFEELISEKIAKAIGLVQKWQHGRRRTHKAYKVVEGGMR